MQALLHRVLRRPTLYHALRHWLLGGLPFKEWVTLYGLDNPDGRVADLGCGPADVLRYVQPENQPRVYLGIDFDAEYLQRAQRLSQRLGLNATFVNLDLAQLSHDTFVQNRLVELLKRFEIDRVLLLGVVHHLDDAATRSTLNLLYSVPGVQTVVTQDVVVVPGATVNNLLAARDRGQHVRTEVEYNRLLASTNWPGRSVHWTRPGFRVAQYIHFKLTRFAGPTA
ncbi:MAG TPA: class I SAM-dependent methyltransferase [Tepidisphaeraceae bacterium]|jgi:SAM-dependent methyltransferase